MKSGTVVSFRARVKSGPLIEVVGIFRSAKGGEASVRVVSFVGALLRGDKEDLGKPLGRIPLSGDEVIVEEGRLTSISEDSDKSSLVVVLNSGSLVQIVDSRNGRAGTPIPATIVNMPEDSHNPPTGLDVEISRSGIQSESEEDGT